MSVVFAASACASQQHERAAGPAPETTETLTPERKIPRMLYESDTPVLDQRRAMRANTPGVDDPAPVYTDIEPFLDPTLRAACGWEDPTFYFSTEDDDVGLIGEVKLESLAICLQGDTLGDEPIVLVGHTDARGDAYLNLELGLERAREVKRELVARGVAPSRIETYSRGEYEADDDGKHHDDRRVVVKLDR